LGLRCVLLVLACLSLMLLDHRESHLSQVRQGLSLAVYPIHILVDLPFKTWESTSAAFADRGELLAENDRLKREQLGANFRLQRFAALEVENARLRELLDSTAVIGERVLIAEILAVDLDPYRQRLNVNRGLADDVFVGQALLDANGVVGQVVKVGPLTAEAVLITDADHAVPVTVNRNGLRTIAVGTGDSSRLRLPYLTNSADVRVGDLLVSSGLGGVFPSGYPVGKVIEVRQRPGQSFAEVIAEPVSALDREQEVLLVWSASDEAPAAQVSIAESASLADAQ
jgi:rod shape-determining protein MreC